MKIYRVIAGASLQGLEEQINDLRKHESAKLIGGVESVTYQDKSIGFLQAVLIKL